MMTNRALANARYWFTLFSGALVLAGVSVVIYASTYLNTGGHPPASGIVALLAAVVMTPFSVLCLLASLFGAPALSAWRQKTYFAFLGINMLYVFLITQVWFYKAILGRAL